MFTERTCSVNDSRRTRKTEELRFSYPELSVNFRSDVLYLPFIAADIFGSLSMSFWFGILDYPPDEIRSTFWNFLFSEAT